MLIAYYIFHEMNTHSLCTMFDFNYLFNAMQRKEGVAFVCALHRGDAHFINAYFVVFVHGHKLLINAGAANDPHLVVFCGFQMRKQVRHGREPMFYICVIVVVVAVMGREN